MKAFNLLSITLLLSLASSTYADTAATSAPATSTPATSTPATSTPTMSAPVTAPPAISAPVANISNASQPGINTAGIVDFSGTYKCDGYDPYNKNNYSFPSVVFTNNGDTYNIQKQDANGYPLVLGTGVTVSGVNNAIAVVYWPPKMDYFMVTIYKQNPDGSLMGSWATEAQKQSGTETCTKIK